MKRPEMKGPRSKFSGLEMLLSGLSRGEGKKRRKGTKKEREQLRRTKKHIEQILSGKAC